MSQTAKLEPHPYANIYPMPNEQLDGFLDLEASILDLGILVPIVLYQGRILEGRRRYMAYERNPDKIVLRTEDFVGNDEQALNHSIALNNERRQLSTSQRSLVALRFVNIRPGSKTENQKLAAQIFRVDKSTIKFASFVNTHPASEKTILLNAIDRDELSVSLAYKIAKELPATMWAEAISDDKKAKSLIKESKRRDVESKLANKTRKASNELAEKGEGIVYNVIYSDPPWRFEVRSEAGMDKSPENHYPTMTLDDIRALNIPAAEDCVLFLWATTPHLNNAIEIMEGWGFEYKTCYVWDKHDPGTGYWTRNVVEILLLGTKGSIPAPTPDLMMPQLIAAKKGEHSAKPEVFADGITKMFPSLPKYEMFSRGIKHKGENWFYWGNEADGEEDSGGNGETETITKETTARKPRVRKAKKANGIETEEEAYADPGQ
jgi:N6-adenosine-specific RNA methylase IME4